MQTFKNPATPPVIERPRQVRKYTCLKAKAGVFKMNNKVNYSYGSVVGECMFIREISPLITPGGQKKRKAIFMCQCGESFEAIIDNVRRLLTKSCGCVRSENSRKMHTTHGLRSDDLYVVWYQMIDRCYNTRNIGYKTYGGRGVTVCEEWINDFSSFKDYVVDLKNYCMIGYTLDRKNTNLGYYPGNVRWADKHTQGSNKIVQRNNSSGYAGVFKRYRKWCSVISYMGLHNYIGSFETIEDAVWARNNYIIENKIFEYPLQTIK